jgi:6-phosphofructokinase
VVRELVMCLHYSYGVPPANVLGVVNGYRGFYDAPLKVLTPSVVSAINREVGW